MGPEGQKDAAPENAEAAEPRRAAEENEEQAPAGAENVEAGGDAQPEAPEGQDKNDGSSAAESRVKELEAQIADLHERIKGLKTPEEVQQISAEMEAQVAALRQENELQGALTEAGLPVGLTKYLKIGDGGVKQTVEGLQELLKVLKRPSSVDAAPFAGRAGFTATGKRSSRGGRKGPAVKVVELR